MSDEDKDRVVPGDEANEEEEDELLEYWEDENEKGAVEDTAYGADGDEVEVVPEEKEEKEGKGEKEEKGEKKEKEEKFKPEKTKKEVLVSSDKRKSNDKEKKATPQPPIVHVERHAALPVAPGPPTGYFAPPAWALPGVHAVPLYAQAGQMRPHVPPVVGGEALRETAKHAFTGEAMRQKIPLEVSHADTDEVWHVKLPTVWHEGLEYVHSYIVNAANKASNADLTTVVDLEYQDDEGDFVRVGSTTHLYHELTRAYALRAVVR